MARSKTATKQVRVEDCFVSVIAPLHNQKRTVVSFVTKTAELLKQHYANYELIVVDNGSTDETVALIQPLLKKVACVRVIRLAREYPGDTAIFAGLEAAIGDYAVILIPGEDPIKHIVPIVNELRLNRADLIQGVSRTRRRTSGLERLGRRMFIWYTNKVTGSTMPNNATYLIGMSRRVINSVTHIKGRYRHIRQIGSVLGFKRNIYLYQPQRVPSARKMTDSLDQAIEVAITYSRHPLRFLSWLGMAASIINLLYAFYIVIVYLIKENVAEGWPTLSLQMSGMFFFVFLILSVLSEYIGRILEETRVSPPYHIMEELTSTALVADETRRNVTSRSH